MPAPDNPDSPQDAAESVASTDPNPNSPIYNLPFRPVHFHTYGGYPTHYFVLLGADGLYVETLPAPVTVVTQSE